MKVGSLTCRHASESNATHAEMNNWSWANLHDGKTFFWHVAIGVFHYSSLTIQVTFLIFTWSLFLALFCIAGDPHASFEFISFVVCVMMLVAAVLLTGCSQRQTGNPLLPFIDADMQQLPSKEYQSSVARLSQAVDLTLPGDPARRSVGPQMILPAENESAILIATLTPTIDWRPGFVRSGQCAGHY